MNKINIIETINKLLISDIFRIGLLFTLVILTLYAYYIEPLKHSGKVSYLNLNLKTKILITTLISTTTYCVSIVGLVYTLNLTKNISFIWILILCILIFGIVLHFNDISPIINKDNEQFKSPPKNIISIRYRLLIYYFLIILDILKFYQDYLYYGKNSTYKTTILHQYILNRFGGYGSGIDFWLGWLGIFGILIDYYKRYRFCVIIL